MCPYLYSHFVALWGWKRWEPVRSSSSGGTALDGPCFGEQGELGWQNGPALADYAFWQGVGTAKEAKDAKEMHAKSER